MICNGFAAFANFAKTSKGEQMGLISTKAVANRLHCSTQTVRNAMRALDIKAQTKGSKGYFFNEDQINEIANYLQIEIQSKTENREVKSDKINIKDESYLIEVIKVLERQLDEKQKTIDELTAAIKSLSDAEKAKATTNAFNAASENKEILLTESSEQTKENKRGFFSRLFNLD